MQDEVSRLLTTRFIGRELYYFPELPSTMDKTRELARSGAREGTVVVAGKQTHGRGRLGRTWFAAEGSLAMSVILHPALSQLPQLLMLAALAVVDSVYRTTGVRGCIKWPNDVLVGGRKLCGILTESELQGNQVKFAVVGIGLNVNFDTGATSDISHIATSLSRELGHDVSLPLVTARLLDALETLYLELKAGHSLAGHWRESLETLGRTVKVRTGQLVEEGRAESVTDDGSLLLRRADGSLATIVVGDVTIVKDQ